METNNNKISNKKELTKIFDLLKSQLLHDFEGDADLELKTLNGFIDRLKTEKLNHLKAVARFIITEPQYRKFPTLFVIEDVLNTLFPMREIAKEICVETIKQTIEEQANKETKEWLKTNKRKTPEEIKRMIQELVDEKLVASPQ